MAKPDCGGCGATYPILEEVAAAISRIVAEGRRASEIVTRIRAFLKKQPAQQDMLEIGEIIEEAALLVERELSKDDITMTLETKPGLPPVRGDRIQLQQVLVNLMVNAGQAMAEQSGPRIVTVSSRSCRRQQPCHHGEGHRSRDPTR